MGLRKKFKESGLCLFFFFHLIEEGLVFHLKREKKRIQRKEGGTALELCCWGDETVLASARGIARAEPR